MDNTQNMQLKISASPHVRHSTTTSDIMFDVILALVPATVFGIYSFGWYAGVLVAVCILTSVLTEYLYQKGMKIKVTVSDLSATLTGLLIALNLPPEFPIWMAMVGCVFAIIIVKQLFGGLGQNFMNPALGARCFLLLAFSKYMTRFVYDGVTTATPLAILKSGKEVDLFDMFMGHTAGTIGETSTIALLIGAVYLLIKKVISPKIPVIYILTFGICIAIYAAATDRMVIDYTLAHLCGGGLMLGAWFMATDYVTSPITSKGKIVYGILLGLLTFVLRIYGASAEGVSYAIIISNLFVPLIEKATLPKGFGAGADKRDNKDKKVEKKDESDTEAELASADSDKGKNEKFDTKGIMKAIVSIFAITIVMGAALALVYNVTKDPIKDASEKAKQDAYKKVLSTAETVEPLDEEIIDASNTLMKDLGYDDVTVDEICVGCADSGNPSPGGASDDYDMTSSIANAATIEGMIYTVTDSAGYGGDIQIVVGIDLKGSITGVSFLKLNETAGLGMEAADASFTDQYIGKDVDYFTAVKTGATAPSEIDAISGATITTNAVTDAINAALVLHKTFMPEVSD